MQAALEEDKAVKDKKEEKKEEPKKTRDTTIKIINMEKKTCTDSGVSAEELAKMITLAECCTMGDLKLAKEDSDSVFKALTEGSVNSRFECEKGEMLLHKLARVNQQEKAQDLSNCLVMLCNLMRKQVAHMRRTRLWPPPSHGPLVAHRPSRSAPCALPRVHVPTRCHASSRQAKAVNHKNIAQDVQHMSKNGKTALQLAVENNNKPMIDFLFKLDKEGPDVMQVRQPGRGPRATPHATP